jgi:hypothetical protein
VKISVFFDPLDGYYVYRHVKQLEIGEELVECGGTIRLALNSILKHGFAQLPQ